MKKVIATLLGILTITSMTNQVFAANIDINKDFDKITKAMVLTNPVEERNSILIINGKQITIKSSELKIFNNNLMVPLKTTAESLGFKVTLNKEGAVIDNDEIKSIITVGSDSYSYSSSHLIGAIAPYSLGAAPIIENGTIYVPIKLYNLIFNDSQAADSFKCIIDGNKQIYISNGSISTGWNKIGDTWYYMGNDGVIKAGWIKDNYNWYFFYDNGVIAANTITHDGYKVDSSGKWDFAQPSKEHIPSPIVEFKTVKEAENSIKFRVTLPAFIPENYKIDNISVISNELFQISYKNNDNELLFRIGKFSDSTDISGDYNIYEREENIESECIKITLKENNNLVYSAQWSKEDMRNSISNTSGIERNEILKLIESIK